MAERELDRLAYAKRQRDVARDQRDRLEAAWNDERDRRLTAEAERDRLLAEVRRLRDDLGVLAAALRDAAQAERSRVATAQHRKSQADGWLDLARQHLPTPTVADVAGRFRPPGDGMTDDEAADAFMAAIETDWRCACGRHLPCRHCDEGVER